MERIFERTMLYDFYGELLTPHQKEVYESAVFEDMSYTEIARDEGVSRQGVFDLVKRCDRILEEYEEKLHLVERFLRTKNKAVEIRRLAGELDISEEDSKVRRIIALAEDIAAEV